MTKMLRTSMSTSFVRDTWGAYVYPFGNTLPEDLFLCHDSSIENELSGLYLGCGDIRNLLHTISEARRRGSKARFSFVLNDWQPEIIARDVVMLHALLKSNDGLEIDWLLQFWYSIDMTPDAYDFWMGIVRDCIAKTDNAWQDKSGLVVDTSTLKDLRFIWKNWLAFDWSKSSLKLKRNAFIERNVKSTGLGKSAKGMHESLASTFALIH
ncbi:hypothetical protein HK102_002154 [Quaeritorhiza haematococci]|nr:hypothetical protein HK102_002154 [Quaeritorhiza haematococci]